MKLLKKFSLILLFLAVFVNYSGEAKADDSQRVIELSQEIQKLEKQAAEYKQILKQKHQESETFKREISILDNQIAKLRLQILATGNRIELTKLEIDELSRQIGETSLEIENNKKVVGNLIKNLYDFDKQSLAAIILTNPKLSDFFDQIQYVKNLENRLLFNLEILKDLKQGFETKKVTAETKKQEFENLNRKQKNQKTAAEGTQKIKGDLLVKTRGEERRFQQLLSEVEKKKAEFYRELQQLESRAREEGTFIVKVKAGSIPARETKLFSMPYEDDFIITQGYGMTSFARRGAYGGASHNGVDLTAGFGAEIKSIGPGAVLAAGFNNAAGNWVAIRHDNDLVSVYGHMRSPAIVSVGERVDNEIIIGFEGATGFVTGSHLHLSLYHDFFTFIGPKTGQVYFNYWEGSLNPLDYM